MENEMELVATIKKGVPELGIFVDDMQARVSSRDIARIFNKEHFNVIRDIEDKILPYITRDFNDTNFELVKYKDAKGEKRPEYLLTFDGFTLLAMGYTGQKAMDFKVRYINAFRAMGTLITTRLLSKEGYREMVGAIKLNIGNNTETYAKEADMINQIILGMKSKTFKELNGIKENESPRDSAVINKLNELDRAQRLNSQLIIAKLSFEQRKQIIENNFARR